MMRLETRTITLRLVAGSRDFRTRRPAFDKAIAAALVQAEVTLVGAGFRVTEAEAKMVDQGGVIFSDEYDEEAKRQSRPDDIT